MTSGQHIHALHIVRDRSLLFVLGGGAGLALWALSYSVGETAIPAALYLALVAFVVSYSGVGLALMGPVPPMRALGGALIIAVPVTALVSLAGMRHDLATGFLDDPVMLSVTAVLVFCATPFLSVWLRHPDRWHDYAALFDTAWTITVRYTAAWGFVAVFWVLVFLSDALLELVGIRTIDTLMRVDWLRFTVTGALLGLGLAVVYELRSMISPYLILRLLRLTVPLMLVVVGVFVVAVALRGLSDLFGGFSAAGTLMGAAIAAITLISAALDRDDDHAVSTPGLRLATQLLAVLLPVLAGLAVAAVFMRVRQYGWTPDRLLAASAAVFLLAYALAYAVSVLLRRDWAGRIRGSNTVMALAVIVVASLWLTPVLDAYRVSAKSQVARFETGAATLDELPLWHMAHDWGRAGAAGLARLQEGADEATRTELAARIATLRDMPNAFQFEQELARRTAPDRAADLAAVLPIRPDGATVAPEVFAGLPHYRLELYLDGCARRLPDGRPGCVLVMGGFVPSVGPDAQGLMIYIDPDGQAVVNHLLMRPGHAIVLREAYDPVADRWPRLPGDAVAQVLDGAFSIRPSGLRALHVGESVLVPAN